MRIMNNITAMNAHRALGKNTSAQAKSLEKLSSGLAVNRAADDAAGLSISESMRAQIADMKRQSKNAQDGISFIQTAEGALDEISNMLVRMTELNTQKDDGIMKDTDTNNIDAELKALGAEIKQIYDETKFNGKNITATDVSLAKGVNTSSAGWANWVNITGDTAADAATVSSAVTAVSTIRANLGALQNRLESKINNLNCTVENLSAAESRIRDTDMASEMSTFNKQSILVQAATSMLAQANSAPQSVLSLLQ